jgi:hypothetical protein
MEKRRDQEKRRLREENRKEKTKERERERERARERERERKKERKKKERKKERKRRGEKEREKERQKATQHSLTRLPFTLGGPGDSVARLLECADYGRREEERGQQLRACLCPSRFALSPSRVILLVCMSTHAGVSNLIAN